MKAYLIDPFAKTVTETEIADHTDHEIQMKDMYASIQCTIFTVGTYLSDDNLDCILVDDEGLLGDLNFQQFFMVKIYGEHVMPLAGIGLVVGTDARGNTVAPSFSIEEVRKLVTFVTPDEVLATIE